MLIICVFGGGFVVGIMDIFDIEDTEGIRELVVRWEVFYSVCYDWRRIYLRIDRIRCFLKGTI